MKLKTLSQTNVKNKSVLLRIDVNSPITNGKIIDNPRFKASSETIKYLIKNKAKITIIAHQGRKGDKDFTSLEQHAKILSRYANKKILYINYLFGKKAQQSIANLKSGQAIILRNVRYYNNEINIKSKNNKYKEFCRSFDLYINEAFSASHRNHGSIILPPRYLPSLIGFNFQKELTALEKLKHSKLKRKIFILGGSKVEDYLPIFGYLENKNNKIIAAGILANLILTAKGYDLGQETIFIKEKYYHLISKIRKIYNSYKNQIILPVDFALNFNDEPLKVSLEESPFNYKIYDTGPATVKLFSQQLLNADYIFMKGPLGFSEIPQFANATIKILKHISYLTKNKKIFGLIGGGHLTTTIEKYHIPNNFSHISLAGGALLKFMSGEKLQGLQALEESKK